MTKTTLNHPAYYPSPDDRDEPSSAEFDRMQDEDIKRRIPMLRNLHKYYTPGPTAELCWKLASRYGDGYYRVDRPAKIIDPCVGGGAFFHAYMRLNGPEDEKWTLIDLDRDAKALEIEDPDITTIHTDFITAYECEPGTFDYCVTNPPFNQAGDFLLKLLQAEVSIIGFLINETFLFGASRYDWIWAEHPPQHIFAFTKRISFSGDGKTDSHNYVFILWDRSRFGLVKPRSPTQFHWISPEGEVKE